VSEWTVRVVLALADDVTDAALDALADVVDTRDATVARWAGGTGIVVTVDVEQADLLAAASETIDWAERLVGRDVAVVVDVRVCTPTIAEREAFRPDTPDLLAATDVAEVLHVSRQRVHQLARDHPGFPAPYVRLGSGPVWSRPAIEHFDRLWTRKPGRPARAS
jgi:hypothetical protein